MEKECDLEDKTTELMICICDDHGHYGFTYCGNCNYHLKEDEPHLSCPKCEYIFSKIGGDEGYSFGGSDF